MTFNYFLIKYTITLQNLVVTFFLTVNVLIVIRLYDCRYTINGLY